jgi:ankyrin repeat protein
LKLGADTEAKSDVGNTALILVSMHGNSSCVALLLKHDLNLNLNRLIEIVILNIAYGIEVKTLSWGITQIIDIQELVL